MVGIVKAIAVAIAPTMMMATLMTHIISLSDACKKIGDAILLQILYLMGIGIERHYSFTTYT